MSDHSGSTWSAGQESDALDLRGKVCPYVTTDAYRALKRLPPGAALVVLTDYYPAVSTLPDLAQDFGGQATSEQLEEGLWKITIRKGEN